MCVFVCVRQQYRWVVMFDQMCKQRLSKRSQRERAKDLIKLLSRLIKIFIIRDNK